MKDQKDLTFQRGISINSLIENLKDEGNKNVRKNRKGRFTLQISWQEFIELFTVSANTTLKKHGCYRKFIIDDNNISALQQIYLYLTFNTQFEGDLYKGLMLQGAIGCGKSLIMESYSQMQNTLILRNYLSYSMSMFISSQELVKKLKTQEQTMYSKRPLIIDELGREPKQVLHYGNTLTPMIDLLCERADNAVITHGTTNFKLSTLSSDNYYGNMVGDRLRAMFNFITLKGESRRV